YRRVQQRVLRQLNGNAAVFGYVFRFAAAFFRGQVFQEAARFFVRFRRYRTGGGRVRHLPRRLCFCVRFFWFFVCFRFVRRCRFSRWFRGEAFFDPAEVRFFRGQRIRRGFFRAVRVCRGLLRRACVVRVPGWRFGLQEQGRAAHAVRAGRPRLRRRLVSGRVPPGFGIQVTRHGGGGVKGDRTVKVTRIADR